MESNNRAIPERVSPVGPPMVCSGSWNVIRVTILSLIMTCAINAQGILSGMPSMEQAQAVEVSESQKRAVIDKLNKAVVDGYILREKASDVAGKIEKKLNAGSYSSHNDAYSFSKALTSDLRTITNDSHFNVLYHPLLSKRIERLLAAQANADGNQRTNNANPDSSTNSGAGPGRSKDAKRNFFFRKLEVLEGNVGYMKLELIPQIHEAKPTLDFAMGFLGNTDAMIIDLRDNRGGFGGFISYFMSYFFPAEKKLLFTRELSIAEPQNFYTKVELPNRRLDKVPVYILINRKTGSAATNLSYTMQKHGRAVLVGETTGSGKVGAHSAGPFPLAYGFVATIPIGRVVHAKTKSNWNMTGVIPDIPTKGDALDAAHKDALKKIDYKKPTGRVITR